MARLAGIALLSDCSVNQESRETADGCSAVATVTTIGAVGAPIHRLIVFILEGFRVLHSPSVAVPVPH
jgi:hypothetical protein